MAQEQEELSVTVLSGAALSSVLQRHLSCHKWRAAGGSPNHTAELGPSGFPVVVTGEVKGCRRTLGQQRIDCKTAGENPALISGR